MNRGIIADQIEKALEFFIQTLSEEKALEVCNVFNEWQPNVTYQADAYVAYGLNEVGDKQLYKVIMGHTSQADWTPDKTPALYDAIGLNESGYPIWSRPTGSHDAYNKGDIVDYNGTLYKSLIDGNIYSPDEYPQGWEVYVE